MNPALLDHFTEQAAFCEAFGSPFTARLLEALGRDLAAGGPTAALVGDWTGSPRADAVSLRIAGALHAAALSGRDPALAAEYPSTRPAQAAGSGHGTDLLPQLTQRGEERERHAARAAGHDDKGSPLRQPAQRAEGERSQDWNPERVWRAARDFLAREHAWVAEFLRSPPQTNETRRAIALLAGFLELAARHDRVFDMLELGASAGLNLCWDRFAYRTTSWRWGEADAVPIETDWRGPAPRLDVWPRVRSRAACDQNPLDLRKADERLRLRSYIWADQADRLARFDAAAALALANDVRVERADAAEWLEARLARRAPDSLTVVYHSVFYQYPPRETRKRIAAALERAGNESTSPLAWLRLEPEAALGGPRESVRFLVDLITWPGGERRTLAATDGHARFVEIL